MCKTKIEIKRYFLPFLGVFGLVVIEEIRNLYYFPIVFTFGFFVLFWNFPWLVYFTNLKPTYYEDLFINEKQVDDYYLSDKVKKKFDSIFLWTLIVMNSLLMGALSDYWLYKTDISLTDWQLLGVTGGILKLFQSVNTILGQIMISVIKFFVKKEQNKYKLKLKTFMQMYNSRNKDNRVREIELSRRDKRERKISIGGMSESKSMGDFVNF